MGAARPAAILTVVTLAVAACAQPATVPDLTLDVPSSTRLLVVAPHPDDETLAAGGLIQRVRAAGGALRIVVMTSGDAFEESLAGRRSAQRDASDHRENGILRERESIAAMARLGVDRTHIRLLGFPDMGLCLLASTYLTTAAAYESPYTDRAQPPAAQQMIRGVAYRGIDLRLEMEKVVTEFSPTLVVMPHCEDEHPDHCATHIFARHAVDRVARAHRIAPRILYYVIHRGEWPLRGGGGAQLNPPADFPPAEGEWRSLRLTEAEATVKRQALFDYATQMHTMGTFLQAFARNNELFLEGEPASAPECWCDDKTVATTIPPAKYRHKPKTPR
jgi:LmbE family N-acetylglucosaminyl deacetylase